MKARVAIDFIQDPTNIEKEPDLVLSSISTLIERPNNCDWKSLYTYCYSIDRVVNTHHEKADDAFELLKSIYTKDYSPSKKEAIRESCIPISQWTPRGPQAKTRLLTLSTLNDIVKFSPQCTEEAFNLLANNVLEGGWCQCVSCAKDTIETILENKPDLAENVLEILQRPELINEVHCGHCSVGSIREIAKLAAKAKPELTDKATKIINEYVKCAPKPTLSQTKVPFKSDNIHS